MGVKIKQIDGLQAALDAGGGSSIYTSDGTVPDGTIATMAGTSGLIFKGSGTTTGLIVKFQDNSGVDRFKILDNGTITLQTLSGTGIRMVIANASGVIATQAIPIGDGDGIYDGGGNVPSSTIADLADKITFRGTGSTVTTVFVANIGSTTSPRFRITGSGGSSSVWGFFGSAFVGVNSSYQNTFVNITHGTGTLPKSRDVYNNTTWEVVTDNSTLTDPVVRMTMNQSGDFGIGVAPGARLHVKAKGTTTGSAFRVDNSSGIQQFLIQDNGTVTLNNIIYLNSYTVAGLPSASIEAGLIYVSDETGGSIPCFSDGTNWRRVSDRTIAA